MTWYEKQHFKRVEVQVLLGGADHGGILDYRFDGVPCELKATYDVQHEHILQATGYANLCGLSDGYVLHVTARLKQAVVIDLDDNDFADWDALLAYWRVTQKRLKRTP